MSTTPNTHTHNRVAKLKRELALYPGSQKVLADMLKLSPARISLILSQKQNPCEGFFEAAADCLELMQRRQMEAEERAAIAESKLDQLLGQSYQSN